ncbi:MAG: tripartite tricarboxylate transporter substrate binding protein [Betaproteobacteria bacterium]|nr:tripartite tricarboxylate transporter substrate binding protein [Betaproteobacteria bacterium]
MKKHCFLLCMVTLIGMAGGAGAQSWPVKPVRVIVGFAVGVSPDLFLRATMEMLSKRTGQSFVVDNLTGGGGLIASQAAARATPDGYTLYMPGVGVVATDRYMFKNLPYDPDKSFIPASMLYVSGGAFAVAVHPDLKVNTTAELIALAKSKPGVLNYGSDTIGVTAIVGQWFIKSAGIDMVAVPYKSPAQLMQDFVSGRTQVAITTTANLEPFRKAGKFRILGVSGLERNVGAEDIPTIAETLPGFKMYGLGILMAPTGTPAAVVQRINSEMDPVIKDQAYVQRATQFGYLRLPGAGTAQSIAEFIASEREYWGTIMKGLNVQPQ